MAVNIGQTIKLLKTHNTNVNVVLKILIRHHLLIKNNLNFVNNKILNLETNIERLISLIVMTTVSLPD